MNVIKTFLSKVLLIKYSLICLQDVFTTMVDMQWRYTLLAFVASFLVSWLVFAVIWWFISYVHGDYLIENINKPTFIPCILANKNFASAFLFSVETQHTIG
jgi:potassium inwardly-rectifying channel subfamily J